MRFLQKVVAKIISDRERAEIAKKHARDILKPGSSAKSSLEKMEEPKKRPSFLKSVKDAKEDKEFQKSFREAKDIGNIKIHLDIIDDGTIYSSKKPLYEKKVTRVGIKEGVDSLSEELVQDWSANSNPTDEWHAGSDGKDGLYTGDFFSIPVEDVPWKLFDKSLEKDFKEDGGIVEVMPVLYIGFNNLTGKELKEVKASSRYPANPSWMEPASEDPESVTPIDHLQEFDSGGKEQWSIQTDQTHGIKGLVKISKSKLEDPGLSLKGRTPKTVRRAGAENLFQGSRQAVVDFVKQNYPSATKVKFV